jgi:TetR/AcrR family transcriptional regulator, transcriptional repressor for nem operon
MARPREFDFDKALDRAMGVFWMKGYEGASLQDLLKAMKIARGSLYKAFDDKRSIYLAALDRYDRTEVEEGISFLRDPKAGDGLARIRDMLEDTKSDTARRGCFMCNAAIDQARFDPKVEAKVTAMLRRLEDAVAVALKQSRKGARWSAKRRAAAASFVLNTYMGLRVLARSGYPDADLQAIIDAALKDL